MNFCMLHKTFSLNELVMNKKQKTSTFRPEPLVDDTNSNKVTLRDELIQDNTLSIHIMTVL